jgi:hypothetical protein
MKRREMLGALGALPLLSLADMEEKEGNLREQGWTGGGRQREVEGFFVTTLDVGNLPPFKAEAFCERWKDKFTKVRDNSLYKNWVAITLPTRTEGTKMEAYPLPKDCKGGLFVIMQDVGVLPPNKAQEFCERLQKHMERGVKGFALESWEYDVIPVRKIHTQLSIYPYPLPSHRIEPFDDYKMRRSLAAQFAFEVNSCAHRAEFNANQTAQRELREIKKKLREYHSNHVDKWCKSTYAKHPFTRLFGEYL